LTAEGITDTGAFRSRRYGPDPAVAHLEVFFNGAPMTPARYPNADRYLQIAGVPSGNLEDGFIYDTDRPDRWKEDPGIRVHGYWKFDWADTDEAIDVFDKSNRHIRTAPPYGYAGFAPGQRFYFLNVLEELDAPGEYYVDRAKGLLYLFPFGDVSTAEIVVTAAEFALFSLEGVSNAVFKGLTFECGRSDGLSAKNYENITIDSCCFRNFGNRGAVLKGGKRLTVIGSDFYGMGDGCLDITGGDRMTLESGEIEIRNNDFHHFARWSRSYMTGINITAVGVRIRNNIFHDCPHSAIYFYGNEFDIEYNDFYDTCLETGDAGAMYVSFDVTHRGIRVRNNRIRYQCGKYSIGTFGFYTDGASGGVVFENNVLHDLPGALCNNGGYDVQVRDNVCVNAGEFVNVAGHGMHPGAEARSHVDGILKPLFYKVQADRPPYSERYPELALFDRIFKEADLEGKPAFLPASVVIENNVLLNIGVPVKRHWLVKDDMITESGNREASKGHFADPDFGDYRLKGFPDGSSDPIGLTDEPRHSSPVRVLSRLERAGAGTYRLTVRNDSTDHAAFSMRLYDDAYHLLDFPENDSDFILGPGERKSHVFHADPANTEFVEARSDTSGVRPSRAYLRDLEHAAP
jgi:hypothetical protein